MFCCSIFSPCWKVYSSVKWFRFRQGVRFPAWGPTRYPVISAIISICVQLLGSRQWNVAFFHFLYAYCVRPTSSVKIKGVLQGGSCRAIASLENFFRSTPQTPTGIKISTPTDPLGNHTETFKITNKIAFIMISKSAKSLQTCTLNNYVLCRWQWMTIIRVAVRSRTQYK